MQSGEGGTGTSPPGVGRSDFEAAPMSADLSISPARKGFPKRRCAKCSGLIEGKSWCLSWEYGNGRMIFLYYCEIEHLPKNRQVEATRLAR